MSIVVGWPVVGDSDPNKGPCKFVPSKRQRASTNVMERSQRRHGLTNKNVDLVHVPPWGSTSVQGPNRACDWWNNSGAQFLGH